MRISDWSSDVCSSDLHILNPFMIAAKADGRLKPEEPVALSVVEPSPLGLAGAVDLKAVWPWDVVRPEVVTRHDQSSSGSDFRVIQTPRPPAARVNPMPVPKSVARKTVAKGKRVQS